MEKIHHTLPDDLVRQTAEVFDHEEKWLAYLEMESIRSDLVRLWFDRLYRALAQLELPAQWAYYFDEYAAGWYLKAYGRESFHLRLTRGVLLLIPNEMYNNIVISETTFDTAHFEPLHSKVREVHPEFQLLAVDHRRYRFGTVYDGDFDQDTLAWFAGNRTAEFVEQVGEKIAPFLGEEVSALIAEVNARAREQGRPWVSHSRY